MSTGEPEMVCPTIGKRRRPKCPGPKRVHQGRDSVESACATEMEVWEAADNDGAYLPLVLRVPSPDDLPFVEDLVILK